MKYERPRYGEGKKTTVQPAFGREMELPVFDYPISVKENFYRNAKREDPLWIPIPALETQELHMFNLYDKCPEGCQLGPNLRAEQDRYVYHDAWGSSWTFDKYAGGACMTIGTRICDDILKWEEQIHFPDLHEYNLDEFASRYMATRYDPSKVLVLDIYHGPFQSLADFLGGFAEALEAMFVEPEACEAFFDRFAEWMIWLIDKLSGLYPADLFVIHDDWGTEKDAFFSPAMMEELLYEPTKRIIDHVNSLGKLYTFHCCGKVDRFLPWFCQLSPAFLQLQRRVNDIPAYKKEYGDKIGFNAGLENYIPGKPYADDELTRIVRDSLDILAPGGGYLPMVFGAPDAVWKMAAEIYCYSREMFEENRKNSIDKAK
ncbi:MAG: hypothetical protein IK082_09545 [Oscillospiraceae bacterium]|nr:hypothetical protein [Oscillospiraceae bacterium]